MPVRRNLLVFPLAVLLGVAAGLAIIALGLGKPLLPSMAPAVSSTAVVLPAVLVGGLVDGINPCAFTVLLLFVASVASAYGSARTAESGALRSRLLLTGAAFIAAIFVTYLVLGIGLLSVSASLAQNHLGARLGALAALFLGLWMVKDGLLPGWGPRLKAPAAVGSMVHSWGPRGSLAATFGLGALVAACEVPCSGPVYLAIVSLLALQEDILRSYTYLVLYNVMFVTPLLLILALASARPLFNRLAHWNLHHQDRVRVALGSGVVVLGLVVLATV